MRISRLNGGAAIMLLAATFALTGEARADFYRYTDSKGTVCITNDAKAVPPRYRATMKVVKEDALADRDKVPARADSREQAPVVQEPAARQAESLPAETTFAQTADRFPGLKPLLVVLGIIAAFMIVAKLTSVIPSPLVSKIVLIAFFLGIFVFAYKAYANYLTDSFLTVKQKVLEMFIKANERQAPATGESPPPVPRKDAPDR